MRIRWVVFVAAVMLAVGIVSASAQFDEEETSRVGVRVGLFMPSDSDLKDIGSSSWLGVGADWNWKFDKNGDVKEFFSLASYKTGESFKKAAETHITYNRIFRKRLGEEKANYFSVGIGADKVRLKAWVPKEGGGFKYVDDSSWRPMGSLAVGREFRRAYFVEIQVNIVPNWQGVNWSGLTLCVGTRSAM